MLASLFPASITIASSSTWGRWVMRVMTGAGMAWSSIAYQGDKITSIRSMGKTNQKSVDGKKMEASNERVRGAEKSPALNWTASTLRGSFTEVKRKMSSMEMARDRHAITNISLLKLVSWAQCLDRGIMRTQRVRLTSGGTTYRNSTNNCIFLCSLENNTSLENESGMYGQRCVAGYTQAGKVRTDKFYWPVPVRSASWEGSPIPIITLLAASISISNSSKQIAPFSFPSHFITSETHGHPKKSIYSNYAVEFPPFYFFFFF